MKKYFKFMLCFIMIGLLFIPRISLAEEKEKVTLSKCVDGNSARFMYNKNEIKVKFLGIDSSLKIIANSTDEINGSLVSDYVCSLLESADDIRIEYDAKSEKEDKYGRSLVWVFVDGELLQENLVKQGYSKVAFLYDDYKYNETIKNAEEYAKENKLGIWSVEEKNEEAPKKEEPKKDEGIIDKIMNFINDIFEKLLKFIDDIINNIL